MFGSIVAVTGALYLIYFVVSYIHGLYYHRKQARALRCQPAFAADSGIFGISEFLRMNEAVKEKRWVEYISEQHTHNRYTFRMSIFGSKMVATIEPENIKAMLATNFNDFGLGMRYREFYPFLGDGIFTLDGAGWSHARGLLRPQFTRDQVSDLDLMDNHISRLIELIPKDGSAFDIQRLFYLLTIDSATHFLFGESVGSMGSSNTGLLTGSSVGDANSFAEAFSTAQSYLVARTRALGFYWLVNPKEFRDATKRVHEIVDHYVRLAIESRRNPQKENGRYIFAEALAANNDNPKFLRDNMLNILLAGRDTTASLLSSCFFFLSHHPAVWTRLRQTIIENFGTAKNPTAEITQSKLKDIPYLRYVLNEVLRLLPPVPLNYRFAIKDTTLPVGGGPDGKSPIYIEKGTLVTYAVYAMHRRPDFYGADAESFRPERWEENDRRGWEYLPFNGGPRICLGQQYAITEASFTLVRLLQHFDAVENADPDLLKPVIQSNLTLSHDRGVNVRLRAVV